jgi:hypothetical protein
MPRMSEPEPRGVSVTQYHPADTDRCKFTVRRRGMDNECGAMAVSTLIVTDANGAGVLVKQCRRHLCRLSILLIEELERSPMFCKSGFFEPWRLGQDVRIPYCTIRGISSPTSVEPLSGKLLR